MKARSFIFAVFSILIGLSIMDYVERHFIHADLLFLIYIILIVFIIYRLEKTYQA